MRCGVLATPAGRSHLDVVLEQRRRRARMQRVTRMRRAASPFVAVRTRPTGPCLATVQAATPCGPMRPVTLEVMTMLPASGTCGAPASMTWNPSAATIGPMRDASYVLPPISVERKPRDPAVRWRPSRRAGTASSRGASSRRSGASATRSPTTWSVAGPSSATAPPRRSGASARRGVAMWRSPRRAGAEDVDRDRAREDVARVLGDRRDGAADARVAELSPPVIRATLSLSRAMARDAIGAARASPRTAAASRCRCGSSR